MKHLLLPLLVSLLVSSTVYADDQETEGPSIQEAEGSSVQEAKEDSKHEKHAHKAKRKMHKHMRAKHKQRWARTDSNEDGQVDLNEYLAAAEQRFNKMDLNSDGIVTKEEMKDSHHKMRAEHKKAMKAARKARREEADK